MITQPRSAAASLKRQNYKIVAKWVLFGATLGFMVLLITQLRTVLNIAMIAFFFSFLLEPVVSFIEKHGIKRTVAAVFVFTALVFAGAIIIRFVAPVLVGEISQISKSIDEKSFDTVIEQFGEKIGKQVPFLSNPMMQQQLKTRIYGLMRNSVSMLLHVFSTIISLIMISVITFFLLKEGRRMKKAVVSWVPNRYFEMTLMILHKISQRLGGYIRGQLLVASIVGSLSIFALYLLDVRYFFLIGAIAGLANMIPYFGPLIGAVPAVIVTFLQTGSFGAVLGVAVAFAAIQLFENVFISPFIVSKSVELHPLTIIIAILIGGQLMGIFGMLLAVPIASIIKVTVAELAWGFKNYRIFETGLH